MSKLYPDISHHHPVKDWNKIEANCPFIITKATQGTTFVDSALKRIISECEKRKIPYWLYTYLNKDDELAQAKFMVNTCKGLIGKYFVGYILDVECGNKAGNVQKALNYIEGLGYKCGIYHMYADYASYRTVISKRGNNTFWWEARYGKNNGTYSSKYPCHRGVDLHQFSDKGICPGISDKIDLNRITGQGKNEAWFRTPLSSATKKKSNTEIAKEVKNGKWGNGAERKKRLEAAGYDYDAVQKIVNKLCK